MRNKGEKSNEKYTLYPGGYYYGVTFKRLREYGAGKTSTEPKSADTPAYTESEGTDTPAYTEPEPEYENDYEQDTATMGERNALKKRKIILTLPLFPTRAL